MQTSFLRKRILEDHTLRSAFVCDCIAIIEQEVQTKKGFSGLALKNAYKVLGKLNPCATYQATDYLLNDFALQLEPFLQEFEQGKSSNGSLLDFMETRAHLIADSLLTITDEKAKTLASSALSTVYKALRPQAKKHVECAIPNLALTLQKYMQQ